MKKALIIVGAFFILVLLYAFLDWKSLSDLNMSADAAWNQVDSSYQSHLELIPHFVDAVGGIMRKDPAPFQTLSQAEARYAAASTSNQKASAAADIDGDVANIIALAKNYLVLVSSDTVQTLVSALEQTSMSSEKQRYDQIVEEYNSKITTFPSSFVAQSFGFQKRTTLATP